MKTNLSLQEIEYWPLNRIYDLNEILNMESDYESAYNSYLMQKSKKFNKGN